MSERPPSCREVEEVAAELALGMLSGPERASALDHLGVCAACRRTIEELATVTDSLLLLAPEAEPAIGFESRVLAATGTSLPPARRPSRRRSFLRAVAAAVVVVAVGASGLVAGLNLGDDGREEVRSAVSVSANGRATCRAFAFGDERAWVFLSMDAPREWTAAYTVEVITTNGVPTSVGSFRLQGGRGTLGTTIDVPAHRLRTLRVFDSEGNVRYEAPFKT